MLSQYIYTKIITTSNKGSMNKILSKMFRIIRKIILMVDDPLVKCKIGKFTLLLPLSHNLPLYLKDYPNYSYNIGRISMLVKEKYPTLALIDIGANIGDSVAIIRTEVNFPILCIEGNQYFFKILEKNAIFFPDVYLENTYVGNLTGNMKLKIQEWWYVSSM